MVVKDFKKFLSLVVISLLLFNLLYLFLFDLMVKEDTLVGSSYKEFLLKNISSPRLIIESGSNAKYGIDSQIIRDELGIETINISNNASYSLHHKLLRLERYTKKGDIVLLPLEWQYYSREGVTVEFSNRIFNHISYYYNDISLWERIKLSYQIPFGSFFKRVTHLYSSKEREDNGVYNELIHLKDFINRYKKGDRGEVQEHYLTTSKKLDNYNIEHCGEYIFLKQIERGFKLSNTFKDNIELIKKLQKKGVKVIVTWANVAGDDCYKRKYHDEVDRFAKKIRAFLRLNKIPMIGEFRESKFPKSQMYNTFYHILYQSKIVRTKQLIKEIKDSSYFNWFKNENKIKMENFEKVYKTIEKRAYAKFIKEKKRSRLFFCSGWYPKESWGRWSKGESSSLLLLTKIENSKKPIKLKIKSRLYGEKSKVSLYIDGNLLGKFNLQGESIIEIPNNYKKIIEISIFYSNVVPPSQIELNSNDNRALKLGIESIEIL